MSGPLTPEAVARLKEDIVLETAVGGQALVLHSTWGLFSPRRVDPGSRLLAGHLEVGRADLCLEIGCGYGPIGLAVARRCPDGEVHMVDRDFVAVAYAQANAARNGLGNCRVYLSNGFNDVPDLRFDLIASNLPAKVGDEMLSILLYDARAHLAPGGRLVVVTIAGLKDYIKRRFVEVFGNHRKVRQSGTYAVAEAVRE